MRSSLRNIVIRLSLIIAALLSGIQGCIAQFPSYAQFTSSVFKTEEAAKEGLSKLKTFKNDTSKITQLNELGKYFMIYSSTYGNNTRNQQAIALLKEGVQLSEALYGSTSPKRYESMMILARVYSLADRLTEGEKLHRFVIDAYHSSGLKKGEAHAWVRFAWTLVDLENESDLKRTIPAFDKAIALYREAGDTAMEITTGVHRAMQLFRFKHGEPENDLKLLVEKSKAFKCVYLPTIYYTLATLNRYKGNLNDALPYALEALKISRELGDTLTIASYYGEIALSYGELKRSAESILYYKKCLAVREKLNKKQYVIYRTATLMTAEMIKNGQAAEGFEVLKSLTARNPPHGEIEKAIIEHGMANCLAAAGSFELAEKYYRSMIEGYQKNERNGEILLIAYLDAMNFFVSRKQFKMAAAYHDRMIDLTEGTSIARKSEIELCLFKIDSARLRFQEAIAHYQLFKIYNDSIFNKTKSEQIEALHIRYGTEQKDQNIALLKKQTELQQANLVQSEILRNSLGGGTIMLVLLLGLLYNRYRLKTRNNVLLEKQREEISRKNFAQQLLLNEKDWLVREIHHRVKNNFHMVVGLMGTQSAYIRSNEALQALEDSKHRIHTMSLIHQKLYQSDNLSATMMSDYVHELVCYLKDSFNIPHILFNIECDTIELELSYSLPLGLILNEAITNSIKYAFPEGREGVIQILLLQSSADTIRLTIRDNGIGIPFKKDKPLESSMGLNLMKGLTEDIGGIFQVKNENGTVIQIDFHYEAAKHHEVMDDLVTASIS